MKKYWNKALKLIPGGNLLYSKRPEMFLPNKWPTYFKKSKDCYLWDIKNKKYIDMIFAVGTNVLGYGNKRVNNAILKVVKNGNLSTLNTYDEVNLASELLKINKWADMVKFARTGGEANTIAIRIARAASNFKKQNIAVCGYHGWHDWYLSVNLNGKKKLDTHLIKSLNIDGVDKNLKNSSVAFKHNDLDSFKEIVRKNKDIGVVIMEVERFEEVKKDFLKYIRDYTKKNKITLIFDECTSGFRQTYGGLHLKYKINPDICILGKALGNGYPINAVIGTKQVMNKAANSFISSTFWSDRIGPAAALKTLEIMKKEQSWVRLKSLGMFFKNKFRSILYKHNIIGDVIGNGSLLQFKLSKIDDVDLKKYLASEMLKKNILASNVIYLSTAHSEKLLDKYFYQLDKILFKLSKKM